MSTVHSRNEVILSAKGVQLDYDKPILRDINFEIRNLTRPGVQQGQVVALIGRSGIGKTQLFRIIAGLLKPTKGEVRIGADQHPVEAGDVGIVPQNYILFRHRTIAQNLGLALERSGRNLTGTAARDLIREQAEQFDLVDHLKKYPAQLSGGQRQRVSILQQLLTGTRTVLMDEPFSGLDVLMVDRVLALLQKVALLDDQNTLVIVSHDIENAMAISDTVFVLAQEQHKPGATMVESLDLCAMDLAFDPGIREKPRFRELVEHVKTRL